MSSLFNRLRSSAGKTAFEADKLRRINSIKFALRALRIDLDRAFLEMGQAAYDLYQDGHIDHPELQEAFLALEAVQSQIATKTQEIEAIKAEVFVEEAAGYDTGRVCPNGHGAIQLGDNFCQQCGAQAVELAVPDERYCQQCHSRLPPAAAFCAECGRSVSRSQPGDIDAAGELAEATSDSYSSLTNDNMGEPTEKPAESNEVDSQAGGEVQEEPEVEIVCPDCQATLPAGAAFCQECGRPLATPAD